MSTESVDVQCSCCSVGLIKNLLKKVVRQNVVSLLFHFTNPFNTKNTKTRNASRQARFTNLSSQS